MFNKTQQTNAIKCIPLQMFGNSSLHVGRILPLDLSCPGGEAAWEKVDVENGSRVCRDQINLCNQTGHLCKLPADLLLTVPEML